MSAELPPEGGLPACASSLRGDADGGSLHVGAVSARTYEQLRRIARSYFAGRAGHTLQPTALVHEAFAKLAAAECADYNDSEHFVAVAATAMRQILVDYTRARCAQKRGGDRSRVTLHDTPASRADLDSIIAVNDGITRLHERAPRKARVLELRYFGGLNASEIATAMGLSIPTVERDLRAARAWLKAHLS